MAFSRIDNSSRNDETPDPLNFIVMNLCLLFRDRQALGAGLGWYA